MVLDESSFDITAAPGINVPPDYRRHFRSFDGRQRAFVAEGSGGPTWYSEYNVLTGLSARSFGHFKYFVTRMPAGRTSAVCRARCGRCGYKTVTLYPAAGAFLGARRVPGHHRRRTVSSIRARWARRRPAARSLLLRSGGCA